MMILETIRFVLGPDQDTQAEIRRLREQLATEERHSLSLEHELEVMEVRASCLPGLRELDIAFERDLSAALGHSQMMPRTWVLARVRDLQRYADAADDDRREAELQEMADSSP